MMKPVRDLSVLALITLTPCSVRADSCSDLACAEFDRDQARQRESAVNRPQKVSGHIELSIGCRVLRPLREHEGAAGTPPSPPAACRDPLHPRRFRLGC